MKRKNVPCVSTHGGAGYAEGTYIKDKKLYCGFCEQDITNALIKEIPIYQYYSFFESPIKWLKGEKRLIKMKKMTKKELFNQLPKWIKSK